MDNSPLYIIALGASAGGLAELNTFFDHTPIDSVSYVIIQHLSSEYKSNLTDILSRHSKLLLHEVKDGMRIVKNEVYIVPHDKYMFVRNACFHLSDKSNHDAPHLTINAFFASLAEDAGKKVIGIVLSGLGSDGADGVRAIKEAGGMVIVRDPHTTDFNSMPLKAIATGIVDFILEPEAMPDIIEDYVKYGNESKLNDVYEQKAIGNIVRLITDSQEHDFSEYKLNTLTRRIKRRVSSGNHLSVVAYYKYLQKNPEEISSLSKDMLISVTNFFRDEYAFEKITNVVVPDIIKRISPDEELRLWVAGCATGEEAYSLAIIIDEELKRNSKADIVVKIFATDVDRTALLHAGKGIYRSTIVKNVSAERLEANFIKQGEYYTVKPRIRRMLVFAVHDINKNPPYCNMHLISCRNVLIYMKAELQRKVYGMLLFGLKKDGYLFLGSSEMPSPILEHLETVEKKWRIFRNKNLNPTVRFDSFSLPETKSAREFAKGGRSSLEESDNISESVHHVFAEDSGHLILIINQNNEIVKTYGDSKLYLLQKNFTMNLSDLLSDNLSLAFHQIAKMLDKTGKKSIINGIDILDAKNESYSVSLSIHFLPVKNDNRTLRMLVFRKDDVNLKSAFQTKPFHEAFRLDKYTASLEEDVRHLKEEVKTAHDQLDSSNENLQSFNEELLSANEEMQSTNEEMQSVNEELHTINADYQARNKELHELNDDLNNYFRSNVNGQLFVDKQLNLVRYSPATVKLINLLPTDIGRPIFNITNYVKLDTLINNIENAITHGHIEFKEIQATNGLWYKVNIMPYIQESNKERTGAILTFTDITDLKNAHQAINKKNEVLMRINNDMDNFIQTASHDLLAPLGNMEISINVLERSKETNPDTIKFLDVIRSSVIKFRHLIEDISVIAVVEGNMIKKDNIDVDDLLNDVLWSLESKIHANRAKIIKDIQLKKVMFSKKNFRSILYNLISNAIKFKGKDDPVITISSYEKNNDIYIKVQDNGIGIPDNKLKKIFDIYGRLHQDIEGKGIGLYLAKKIIDAEHGTITVETEEGKGTAFVICLPERFH